MGVEQKLGKQNSKYRHSRICILAFAIFLTAFIPRVIFPLATSICYDELAAKDSEEMLQLLKKGDFYSEKWAHYPYLPFYKYIFGMIPEALFGSNPSDPDDLVGARTMGALLGSGIIVMTFLIGIRIMPVPAAAISAVLLAFIPTVLGHDRIAKHDLPSRLLLLISWWYILRWKENSNLRDFVKSAFLSGLAVTFFHRTGLQSGLALAIWLGIILFQKSNIEKLKSIKLYAIYGFISLGVFLLTVWLLWPYMWFRPTELLRWYADPAATATSGGSLEFWLGEIRPVPWYYYVVVLGVNLPPLTLLAFIIWNLIFLLQKYKDSSWQAIFLLTWVPLMIASVTLRQCLSDYLQIIFPTLCLASGWVIWKLRCWINSQGYTIAKTVGFLIISIPICGEIFACSSVSPYFMQYFNILTGGHSKVTEKKLFTQSTYGEAIWPLFHYLKENGIPHSTVLCRLGPWPGLTKLNSYLGSKFPLQGFQAIDLQGAKYILRVGIERDNPFYRYEPNPRFYEKEMDVVVDGGSIGDVWKRKTGNEMENLIYADDFSSPQISQFGVAVQNANLNCFSDGKFFSIKPGDPSIVLMHFPASLFKGRSVLWLEAEAQIQKGQLVLFAGTSDKNLKEVTRLDYKKGLIRSSEFKIDQNSDVYILLKWITNSPWNGNPASFWDTDWIDSLRIFGK